MTDLTETQIQKIAGTDILDKGHRLVIPNYRCLKGWECDLLSVTNSGYLYEYEIKRSRGDFLKERKSFDNRTKRIRKYLKHDQMKMLSKENCGDDKTEKLKNYIPSKFYLITPQDLVDPDELPDLWGLYEVWEGPEILHKKIRAERIHKGKPSKDFLERARKRLCNAFFRNELERRMEAKNGNDED